MTAHTGMCVLGPLDGRLRVERERFFRVAYADHHTDTYEIVTYEHVGPLDYTSRDRTEDVRLLQGLWIPSDRLAGLSEARRIQRAFELLLESYARRLDLSGLRESDVEWLTKERDYMRNEPVPRIYE